jgi:hypothetical protein
MREGVDETAAGPVAIIAGQDGRVIGDLPGASPSSHF